MKVLKLFSALELRGGCVSLNITIHHSKMRGVWMEKSGYNFPSWYFVSMSVYNLLGMRWHGRFYTVVISQYHQQWSSKGIFGLSIPLIARVIMIWDKVFFKLRLYFYKLVSRNRVFSEYIHHIYTYIDVSVEVLEVHSSVVFEFFLDEEFIELWWSGLMFEIPQATNFLECTPSYGESLLLAGTTVVAS